MTNSFSLTSVLATAAEEIVFDKKTVYFGAVPKFLSITRAYYVTKKHKRVSWQLTDSRFHCLLLV